MHTELIDHYGVLGVPRNVTPTELKRQYRSLARTLHPDIAGVDVCKAERFKAITFAYEVLSDTQKRAYLDAELLRVDKSRTTAMPQSPSPFEAAYFYPTSQSERLDREWTKFSSRPLDWTRRVFTRTSNWEPYFGVGAALGIIYGLVMNINMNPMVFMFSTSSSKPLQDNLAPLFGVFIGTGIVTVSLLGVYFHEVYLYYAALRRLRDSVKIQRQAELDFYQSSAASTAGRIYDQVRLKRPSFSALAAELYDMAGWFYFLAVIAGAFIGHFCF